MQESGLETIETYIARCHNTIAQYIATHPILERCLAAPPGTSSKVVVGTGGPGLGGRAGGSEGRRGSGGGGGVGRQGGVRA